MLICSSPKLIAAYHVFHRLPVPRHSPCALVRLTIQTILSREWLVFPLDSFLPTKIIVTLPFEIVIFLKKELTIIFVSQLLFSFQGTSLSVLFRALKIEQYLLNLYLSPVPEANHHAPYDLGYTRATMAVTKRSKPVKASKPQKGCLSSDCSLQLDYMKLESLVIADQHAAVNTFPGLVHTARHTMGVGNARSQ